MLIIIFLTFLLLSIRQNLKAVGLSIDGFGDFVSVAIAECDTNNIKIIKKNFFPILWVFFMKPLLN